MAETAEVQATGPAATKSEGDGSTGPFSEGEKVLAPQGGQFYEAKILAAERRKKGAWEYYVHYQGWNKKWDEWVTANDLLKANADADTKKRKMDSADAAAAKRKDEKKSKAGGDKGGGGGGKDHKKKQLADADVEEREARAPGAGDVGDAGAIKLPLPSELKKALIGDWEAITKENKLVALPRSPTVAQLLDQYMESRKQQGGAGGDEALKRNLEDVVAGIRMYFDKALRSMLLYRQERAQCEEHLGPEGASATEVYGAEHLLRLFVKLPELLPYTNLEEAALNSLTAKLSDVLRYLAKNHSTLFAAGHITRT